MGLLYIILAPNLPVGTYITLAHNLGYPIMIIVGG